jgi:hypothetical protein
MTPMIEAIYKKAIYKNVTATKVLAVIVMIASAWELLRLHGIALDGTILLEIFYAALIGLAARVIVELSPQRSFPRASKSAVVELPLDDAAIGRLFGPNVAAPEAEEAKDERPPYRYPE